jgi:hypothetical protein
MLNKYLLILAGLVLLASDGRAQDAQNHTAPPVLQNPKPGYSIADQAQYVGQLIKDPQASRWKLLLKTNENYPCSNAHINALSIVNDDKIIVHIDKIKPVIQPNFCVTSYAPAIFSLSLPTPNKPLTLDISNGHENDRYKISFKANVASVSTVRAAFTYFLDENDHP